MYYVRPRNIISHASLMHRGRDRGSIAHITACDRRSRSPVTFLLLELAPNVVDHRLFRAAAPDEGDGTATPAEVPAAANPTVTPAAGCSDGRAATRQQQYAAAKNACTVHWAMAVSLADVSTAPRLNAKWPAASVADRRRRVVCVRVCGVSGVCVYVCILACARARVCVCVCVWANRR